MKRTLLITTCLILGWPALALASESVFVFRSVEDPSLTPDPNVCATAPFRVNLRLVAALYSVRTRADDGEVVKAEVKRIGVANACGQITHFGFPPGLQQRFHVRFDLPEGSVTATGTCTLISNNVPRGGVVLAGCALAVTEAPESLGGMATSASVLNPFRLTGFNTGSYWTLQLYHSPDGDGEPHQGHDHDLEAYADPRSDQEIATQEAR